MGKNALTPQQQYDKGYRAGVRDAENGVAKILPRTDRHAGFSFDYNRGYKDGWHAANKIGAAR